jgi:CRP-like cAMP-binding protein
MTAFGAGNQLLEGLPPREVDLFEPEAQETRLRRGDVIADAGQPVPFVYFPIQGVLSLVGVTEGGATVEVAVVGREGMATVDGALGRPSLPFRVVAQIDGCAWRLPSDLVAHELKTCGVLHERVLAYSHTMIAQVAQSAVCNRFHNARQRLARWLLMTANRADSRDLPLTHEFISHMVGGPRSAVTEAAAALRATGAIDYRRGLLTIRSLPRLRQLSCECYGVVEDGRQEPRE